MIVILEWSYYFYLYIRTVCEGLVLTSLDGIGATKVEKAGKSFIGGSGD